MYNSLMKILNGLKLGAFTPRLKHRALCPLGAVDMMEV
jgi:hypothetical protein